MASQKKVLNNFSFPFLLFGFLEVTQTVGQAYRTVGNRGKMDHYATKLCNYSGNKPKKMKYFSLLIYHCLENKEFSVINLHYFPI